MKLEEKRDQSIKGILDAALEVFAEKGFSGARMDAIAKKAGVNKAMLYYRIGDKKALYDEVLHNVFGGLAKRVIHAVAKVDEPQIKLKMYVRTLLETVEIHPHLWRLMMWEFASGGKNFSELAVMDLAQMLGMLATILNKGKEKDIFIKTDPVIPHLMIVGAMVFNKASKSLRKKYTSEGNKIMPFDEKPSEDDANEIEKLILRAMMK